MDNDNVNLTISESNNNIAVMTLSNNFIESRRLSAAWKTFVSNLPTWRRMMFAWMGKTNKSRAATCTTQTASPSGWSTATLARFAAAISPFSSSILILISFCLLVLWISKPFLLWIIFSFLLQTFFQFQLLI